MKTMIMIIVACLIMTSCTKNTQELTEPQKHVIDPGITTMSTTSFIVPKGIQPAEWNTTSNKVILSNGITMYQTASLSDPTRFLVDYRTKDKEAIRIATFKIIASNMKQFTMSDTDGNIVFQMSFKNDNHVGDFRFPAINNQKTPFGECMQHQLDLCWDSWGCSAFMVMTPVVSAAAIVAYCTIEVGSTYHVN